MSAANRSSIKARMSVSSPPAAIVFGAYAFVVFNCVLLVLAAVPLIAAWRQVFGRRPALA